VAVSDKDELNADGRRARQTTDRQMAHCRDSDSEGVTR